MTLIYKLIGRRDWLGAVAAGRLEGSPADLADGFIHFSTAAQLAETARRHFAGQDDLMLLSVEAAGLGQALVWEVSRGGALFPHLYGPLLVEAIVAAASVALDGAGLPILPIPAS